MHFDSILIFETPGDTRSYVGLVIYDHDALHEKQIVSQLLKMCPTKLGETFWELVVRFDGKRVQYYQDDASS
jgi:hypothetical protein